MKAFLASSPNLSEAQLNELSQLVGKEKANKVLVVTAAVVPYGLEPKPEWVERAIEPLHEIANEVVETSLEDGDMVPDNLSQYDLVFVTGGNVFYLAYRLEETRFGSQLQQYVADGGVYAGSSAGSAILMSDLTHFKTADDPAKAPKICSGLGLLDEAIIFHADHEKYAPIMKSIAKLYATDRLEVVTVNDGQAFLIAEEEKKII